MGYFNEKTFIQNNILNHQDRLNSQVMRFLDTVPTYVTFYDVNTIESTANSGTLSVDKLWGPDSPIKFNGVRNLPIYGINPINPDLELLDEGVQVRYEGEGILLPHTVRAKPNSFFTIDVLPRRFVFRVTSVNETTINSNSYMMLNYELYATDEVVTDYLNKQTVMWYRCIPENIGTENTVLMLDGDLEKIELVKAIIEKNHEYYKMLFYDKRYNSFLFNRDDGIRLYDRLLTRFMIDTGLFRRPKEFESIVLTEEDDSNDIPKEYYTSIFNAVMERDVSYLEHKKYFPFVSVSLQSVFHHWRDRQVFMTRTGIGADDYIRPELVDLLLFSEKCCDEYKKKCCGDDDGGKYGCGYIEIPDIDNKPVWVSRDPVKLDPFIIESDTVKITVDELGNTVDVEPTHKKELPIIDDTTNTEIPQGKGDGLDFDSIFGEDDTPPTTEDKSDELGDMKPTVPEPPKPKMNVSLPNGDSITYISDKPVYTSVNNGVKRTDPLDVRVDTVLLNEQLEQGQGCFTTDMIVAEEIPQPVKPVEWKVETKKVLPTMVIPNEVAEGENIMINMLVMFFGGCEFSLDEETLDLLMKPHKYMKNNHETYIIAPIFLYILQRLLVTLTGPGRALDTKGLYNNFGVTIC